MSPSRKKVPFSDEMRRTSPGKPRSAFPPVLPPPVGKRLPTPVVLPCLIALLTIAWATLSVLEFRTSGGFDAPEQPAAERPGGAHPTTQKPIPQRSTATSHGVTEGVAAERPPADSAAERPTTEPADGKRLAATTTATQHTTSTHSPATLSDASCKAADDVAECSTAGAPASVRPPSDAPFQNVVDLEAIMAASWPRCHERDEVIRSLDLLEKIDSVKNRKISLHVFDDTIKCLEFEEHFREASDAKWMRKALSCWSSVNDAIPKAPKDRGMVIPGKRTISYGDFWKLKRPEVLRDWSALSSIDGRFYKVLRIGVLDTADQEDAAVKEMIDGLADPLLRCSQHWLAGFDSRQQVARLSLWRRYADLLLVLLLLGRPEVGEVWKAALLARDNKQQWESLQRMHVQLPYLRATPFWETGDVPWTTALEERFAEIQGEMLALQARVGQAAFGPDDGEVIKHLASKSEGDWLQFTLYQTSPKIPWIQNAPVMLSILREQPALNAELGSLRFPPRLREAIDKFNSTWASQAAANGTALELQKSVAAVRLYQVRSGGALLPHFGLYGRLAAFLGIQMPDGSCSIRVGGEHRNLREGEVVVHDDSFVQEFRNNGADDALVLGVFFVHPELL